jgi:23S rRNA (pseudouridine1915-N3)-methyltransferase
MKIRFVMLGKMRREGFRVLFEDYATRIRRYAELEVSELREASIASLHKLKIDPNASYVLLDADGKRLTSAEFAKWLEKLRDNGTREIVFLCGDAEGFSKDLRDAATQKISLSSFTMPHEFARVILAEQVYRAFTILAGHPYSK